VLVDRATFPRRKPCGEGLFPLGVAELNELGVLPAVEAQGAELRSLRFTYDNVSATTPIGAMGRYGLGVARATLDQALGEAAQRAGAEFRCGVTARSLIEEEGRFAGIQTFAGQLEARVVIGADGLRSALRRQAGLDAPQPGRRRYGVTAHLELATIPEPSINVYFRRGYEVYVTPVGGRNVNAAVLMGQDGMSRFAGRLRDGFLELLEGLPVLEGARLIEEPLAAGPFPASAKRAWRANLVLAGDAAGFFDGITGEGMSIALRSARQCAAAVDSYLDSGDEAPLQRYDKQRRVLARNSTLLARLSLSIAARPTLARRLVTNLARRPATFPTLVAINAGELPLSAMRPRDVLALAFGL
jgi:flavin-dependent dehydrogenase